MEYRSPLGYNFKLEQSLNALKEEKDEGTPKKDDFVNLGNSGPRKFFDAEHPRNSGGNRNYSPAWQRNTNNWKYPSPRSSQQDEPVPIENFYHPSMLENPWEEFEKGSNSPQKST